MSRFQLRRKPLYAFVGAYSLAQYTEGVMSSEREPLPESIKLGTQDTPEERLLKSIFGQPDAERIPATGAGTVAALAQRWITGHLPAAEIEEISTLASAVIGDRSKATQWLSEPNIATDNRAPIDLIGEKDGYERVKSLLLRIEYGVLA